MTDAIIAAGLDKTFNIYPTPRSRLVELITRRPQHTQQCSLKNVNFTVRRGEVFGIVGRNGAGKSTLLKLIAGTLQPTDGHLQVNGRVTAILELGNGFHPEFTGRENIYLGGLCMGMSRSEIDRKLPEIVAFSELGEWIDRPFKTYSSGMQARLTFSTATSVDPDILIVDEALSVGDARFQLKSFDRIRQFRAQGKTILLVSHDHTTITSFCDRALLLDFGQVLMQGVPGDVCNAYHKLLFGEQGVAVEAPALVPAPAPVTAEVEPVIAPVKVPEVSEIRLTEEELGATADYGSQQVVILQYAVRDLNGAHTYNLLSGQSYDLFMRLEARQDVSSCTAGFLIRSVKGVDLFGLDSRWGHAAPLIPALQKGDVVDVRVRITMNLAAGNYFLTMAAARDDGFKFHILNDVIELKVQGPHDIYTTSLVDLQAQMSVGVKRKAEQNVA